MFVELIKGKKEKEVTVATLRTQDREAEFGQGSRSTPGSQNQLSLLLPDQSREGLVAGGRGPSSQSVAWPSHGGFPGFASKIGHELKRG